MYKMLNEDFKVKLSFWASILASPPFLYLSPSNYSTGTFDISSAIHGWE
jgi:hypothetical protein